MVTGGRLGRFGRYIFSDKTPVIMVCCSPCVAVDILTLDYIRVPHERRDVCIFQHDMEEYTRPRGVVNTLVVLQKVWLC